LETSLSTKLSVQIQDSWKSTDTRFKTLQARIDTDLQKTNAIESQRETVLNELNDAFETLRDELGTEVRNNTMDELYDDLLRILSSKKNSISSSKKHTTQPNFTPVLQASSTTNSMDSGPISNVGCKT
jgi:hypothetical protein